MTEGVASRRMEPSMILGTSRSGIPGPGGSGEKASEGEWVDDLV